MYNIHEILNSKIHVEKVKSDFWDRNKTNLGNLVLFFGRQKQCFARMTKKKFNDDNDGCNDNYDDNYGNFDDDYDKND